MILVGVLLWIVIALLLIPTPRTIATITFGYFLIDGQWWILMAIGIIAAFVMDLSTMQAGFKMFRGNNP